MTAITMITKVIGMRSMATRAATRLSRSQRAFQARSLSDSDRPRSASNGYAVCTLCVQSRGFALSSVRETHTHAAIRADVRLPIMAPSRRGSREKIFTPHEGR